MACKPLSLETECCDDLEFTDHRTPPRAFRRRRNSPPLVLCGVAILAFLSFAVPAEAGWSWGSSDGDPSMYGDSFDRDWLYDASAMSLKIEGCVWSVVDPEDEDSGCMEQDSDDGTTYWYQMSNCKRAQVAFSIYASDSGKSVSCSSSSYKETFVTKYGLGEFLYYLKQYDTNNPFGGGGGNDDGYNAYGDGGRRLGDDDGYGGYGVDDLPICGGDNGYMGVGCASDGTFTIDTFNDQYCLSSSGTYDALSSLNSLLKHYKKCGNVYNDNGNTYLAQQLVPYATSCSSLDSPLCQDDDALTSRRSGAASNLVKGSKSGWLHATAAQSWASKVKYGAGCLLLLASFVMFTGILFTNRRRRRALMQRKYRQSRRKSKSRSKSRHRGEGRSSSRNRSGGRSPRDEGKSRRSSKSRSKSKSKRTVSPEEDTGGVFT